MRSVFLIYFLFLFLSFYPEFSFSKNDKDSIGNKLSKVTDIEKIKILNNLAEKYLNIAPDNSIYFAKIALKTQRRASSYKYKSLSFNLIGDGYKAAGNNIEALNFYQKALIAAHKYGTKEDIAKTLNNIGVIYRLFTDYNRSLEYHKEALELYKETNFHKGIAQSYNYSGIVYRNLNQTKLAMKYYNDAYQLSIHYNIKDEEAFSLLNLGNIYWYSENYSDALLYYERALFIFEKLQNYSEISAVLNNIGNVKRELGNLQEAMEYLIKSFRLAEKYYDRNQLAVTLRNIGKTFQKQEKSDSALYYYKLSLNFSLDNDLKRYIQDNYQSIAEIYNISGLKNEAIKYLKLYIETREKNLKDEKSQSVLNLQYKFELDKKEDELKNLNLYKNQILLYIVLLFTLFISIIAIIIYRSYINKKRYVLLLENEVRDRKKAEQLLSESEERFRTLADLLPETIYESNENGIFTYVNKTGYKLFGYEEEDLSKGLSILDAIAPFDRLRALDNRNRTVSGEKTQRVEYTMIKNDGSFFPALIHTSPVIINGITKGTRGIVVNISEQKKKEEEIQILYEQSQSLNNELLEREKELQDALKLTEKLYEKISASEANLIAVFNSSLISYVLISLDLRIISFNNAAKSLIKEVFDKDIAATENSVEILPLEYLDTFKKNMNLAAKGETIRLERSYCLAGKNYWFDMIFAPAYDIEKKLAGISFSFIDITTRKKIELALKENEEKYRLLIEQAVDGIIVGNIEGKIIIANSGIANISGYSINELLEKNFNDIFIFSKKNTENFYPLNIEPDEILLLQGSLLCSSSEIRPVEVNLKRMHDNTFQAFIRDLTERKLTDDKLREMQRSISTLTENLSGMAYRCLNDKNRTIEVVSKGAKSLTGYAADDFIQNKVVSYNNIIYDEDRQKVRDITNKAIELNIGYQISYRIITAGNEIKWVWEQGCAVFNSDGKVVALEGYISDITEKKMMEEALIKSEERFRMLVENQGEGVVIIDKDELFTFVNPAAEELFGLPQGLLIGMSLKEFVDEKQFAKIKSETKLRKLGRKSTYEITLKRKDKQIRHILATVTPYFSESKQFIGSLNIFTDITHRKIAEEKLKNSEQRLQYALDATSDGIWDYNPQLNSMDYLSSRFYTMLGFEPNEFKIDFLKLLELIHEKDRTVFKSALSSYLKNKTHIFFCEFRMKSKTEKYIWINSRGKAVAWNEKGNITRIVGTNIDISERKAYEETLIESEAKFRAAFENVNYGKAIISLEGKFIKCNPAISKILGYSEKELETLRFSDITYKDDVSTNVQVFKDMLKGKLDYISFEKRYITKSRTIILALLDVSIIKNKNGEPIYFVTHIQDITHKKIAEEALRESEEKFKLLAEKTTDIIWTFDLSLNLTYLNPAIKKQLGFTVSEYMNLTDEEKYPPESKKIINSIFDNEIQKINKGIQPGKNYSVVFEIQLYHKNGTLIWGEINFTFLYNESDVVYGIHGITRNVTERKRVEEAMRKSEERLKLALDAANDGLWDINLKSKYVNYYSPRWYAMLNYDPYEFPMDYTSWIDLIHPEDKQFVLQAFSSYSKSVINVFSVEYRMKSKNGNYKWILSRGKQVETDDEGEITRMIGTHIDISERKEAEDALLKSRKKYMDLTEFLPQSVFECDTEGNLIFANRQAFLSFGYNKEDFEKGLNVIQMIAPKDKKRAFQNFKKNIETDSFQPNEYLMIKKDGSFFPAIIYSISSILDSNTRGVRGIIVDITERKLVEEQLIAAKEKAEESDSLKSAFLANMSHEIRTPMNAILGFTELLKTTELSEEKRHNFIDIISKRGKDLLNIINDIIDISKIESKQLKINKVKCYLNNVIKELYTFFESDLAFKEKKSLKLKYKMALSDTECLILADDLRIKQILTNLLGNAVKFTSKGFIEFGYTIKNIEILFYVKDTGIGIPEEKQSMIFDRFRQADDSTSRQFGGTGLGLAISKSLSEMMGGKIWVESTFGKGSIFYFTLPYTPVRFSVDIATETTAPNVRFNWSDKTILIAEDDKVNFLYLSTLLKRTKVKIIHALNGEIAVKACRDIPEINLVLMDVQMPVMNGFEATKLIKKNRPALPVIAQTAYAMKEDKVKCTNAGCNDFVAKPIKIDNLLAVIEKYFN
ncbi:MAG: hypothetical protein A2275_04530 [Bacteroidetes bacterium RIFOXYA12_FULL_35_11]|nr:MAG: hypothetical protein A2X01_13775 [Bacteroidetes bacterium GWF2_35_48]OFY75611.1 MAG: hypothetical protein A2275_04530 [Bacteroidetes bacterium RIFOXYA12_FULL_35_11]HBX52070.1 hypothetical protein [Bacteroidales bacterium]